MSDYCIYQLFDKIYLILSVVTLLSIFCNVLVSLLGALLLFLYGICVSILCKCATQIMYVTTYNLFCLGGKTES